MHDELCNIAKGKVIENLLLNQCWNGTVRNGNTLILCYRAVVTGWLVLPFVIFNQQTALYNVAANYNVIAFIFNIIATNIMITVPIHDCVLYL